MSSEGSDGPGQRLLVVVLRLVDRDTCKMILGHLEAS